MIAIIDYDAGNIKSVQKAINLLGEETVLTREREDILAADKVISLFVRIQGIIISK